MVIRVLLLCSFLFSCAGQGDGEEDAGQADTGPDAWANQVHPCQEDFLNIDPWNCGECGAVCSVDDSDSCTDGACLCGVNPSCPSDSDCRYGNCIPVNREGEVCEFDPECAASFECIEGRCTFVRCVAEECDGIDNDCDGRVDESESGDPLAEWCFSGPEPENILLPCQSGVRVCQGGAWSECFGEIPPSTEQGLLGCDGVDNDCDGCVDGVLSGGLCESREPDGFDIVYLIDISGSMASVIEAVVLATDTFSAQFANNPSFRFALVTFPTGDAWTNGANVSSIITDFTDFATFQVLLAAVTDGGGGSEPNWDAVYESGTGELPLSWAAGSVRIIIEFTDENGQSYRQPAITEAEMCTGLTHGEVLAFFTKPINATDFDDCGQRFDISDAVTMQLDLEGLISDPCL